MMLASSRKNRPARTPLTDRNFPSIWRVCVLPVWLDQQNHLVLSVKTASEMASKYPAVIALLS